MKKFLSEYWIPLLVIFAMILFIIWSFLYLAGQTTL